MMPRLLALTEILLVSGFFSDAILLVVAQMVTGTSPAKLLDRAVPMSIFMISSSALVLFIAFALQRARHWEEGLRIRWRPPGGGWAREIAAGACAAPACVVAMMGLKWAFDAALPGYATHVNPLLDTVKTPLDLAALLTSGIVSGSLREEVQRAFVLQRGVSSFGAPFLTLAVWSAYFGITHARQGPDAILVAATLGAAFGLFYLWRKSVVMPMVGHALFNVIVLLLYWFTGRGRA